MRIDTSAKHYLFNIDDIDIDIYRVLEVSRLFDIFETRLLELTSPKSWADPYENFLKYSYGIEDENENVRHSFEGCSKLIFGQCWTLNAETDAVWRIYSPNKDRAKVKTTIRKLYELVQKIQDKWFRSYIGKVKYLPEVEIKKNISKGIEYPRNYFFVRDRLIKEYYLVKRDTFKYENEIRLIVNLPDPPENYVNAIYQDPDNLDTCNIPLDEPGDLFDEIVFDPRMPDSLVRAYTSHLKNEFKFAKDIHKSNLYLEPKIKQKILKLY